MRTKGFSVLSLLSKIRFYLYKNLLSEVISTPFSISEKLHQNELYARSIQTTIEKKEKFLFQVDKILMIHCILSELKTPFFEIYKKGGS